MIILRIMYSMNRGDTVQSWFLHYIYIKVDSMGDLFTILIQSITYFGEFLNAIVTTSSTAASSLLILIKNQHHHPDHQLIVLSKWNEN